MPKNKATLYNDILTKITSNGQGDITGAVLASVLNDFVGSFQNSIDDSSGGAAVVANIAARDALTGDDLWHGRLCYVLDASADVTVDAGAALYIYDEDNTDWIKLTEFESLDLDLSDYVTSAELTTALGGYVTKSGTVNMTNTAVWNFNNGAEVIQIDTPNAQVEWNTAGSANGYVVISGDGLYVEDDTQYNTTVSQTGVSAQSSTFLNEVTHNSVSFTDLGAVKTHEFVASADRITLQSDLAGFKGLMAGSDISANLGALSYVWKGWVENYVSTELVAYALDTDLTNYVAKAGSTMDNNADITFAGGGEVLGLPNTPSVGGAATSKTYVDAQDAILSDSIAAINTNLGNYVPKSGSTSMTANASLTFTKDDATLLVRGDTLYMEDDATNSIFGFVNIPGNYPTLTWSGGVEQGFLIPFDDRLRIDSSAGTFKGLVYNTDISANLLDNSLTHKKYVVDNFLAKAGGTSTTTAIFNFRKDANNNIEIDVANKTLTLEDTLNNTSVTLTTDSMGVSQSGALSTLHAGFLELENGVNSATLQASASMAQMQVIADTGLNVYSNGSNGSGDNWVSCGDWAGTSYPYVGFREWGGTDSDASQTHGRLGHYWTVGTDVATAKMFMNNTGQLAVGGTTIQASHALTVTGDSTFNGHLKVKEQGSTPSTPTINTECNIYMKADKLIVQFNNGGTIRYYYLDMTTAVNQSWIYTGSAP